MGIVGYKCRLTRYFDGSFFVGKIWFSYFKRKIQLFENLVFNHIHIVKVH